MNNTTAPVYFTAGELLDLAGSQILNEQFWLFFNIPLGIIGTFLNILCAIVLFTNKSSDFSTPLYKYLRVYTINSAQTTFFVTFAFLGNTGHLIPFNYTYTSSAIFLYVIVPFSNLGYFYGTLLDILMTIDRIASMSPRLKSYIKLTPYQHCFICFVICLIVDMPFFFMVAPNELTAPINSTHQVTVWFTGVSEFSRTKIGHTMAYTVYILRDAFTMFIVIILNAISLYLLREYLSRKASLLNRVDVSVITESIQISKQASLQTRRSQSVNKSKSDASKALEQKLALMVCLMNFLTLVEHAMLITTCFYPHVAYFNPVVFRWVYSWAIYAENINHSLNFFFIYCFNKNFKSACKNLLRIQS